MRTPRHLCLILALLLINLEVLNAATILGKVAVYSSPSNPEMYPLVSGNRLAYGHKALIRISGGTLIADKGTVFKVLDGGDTIAFQIEKGDISFKLRPHKIRLSFKTPQGEIASPRVAPASSSIIEGRIVVGDNGTTIVDVSEGMLEALTPNGLTKINSGQGIILAQSKLAQGDLEKGAVPEGRLEDLVGKEGSNMTKCTPACDVKIDDRQFDGVVVDDQGNPIEALKDNPLPEDTELVVKNVVKEKEILLLGVQPKDRSVIAAYLPTAGSPIGAFLLGGAGIAGTVVPTIILIADDDDDEEASPITP